MLIPEELAERAERFGARVAVVVDGGAQMTFREWDERANAVARGLVAKGSEKGDRVGLLMPPADAIEFCVGDVAAQGPKIEDVPILVPVNSSTLQGTQNRVDQAIGR